MTVTVVVTGWTGGVDLPPLDPPPPQAAIRPRAAMLTARSQSGRKRRWLLQPKQQTRRARAAAGKSGRLLS